jgi:hypothetical protein
MARKKSLEEQAKFDGLTEVDMSHFNAVLSRMAGVVIL